MDCFNKTTFLEYFENGLLGIIKQENIENAEILDESPNAKGEGYVGMINSIMLRGSNKTVSLICKFATNDEKVRKCVPITECFITEMVWYGEVLPIFYKMQEERKVEKAFCLPKCYWINKEYLKELIMLDNLKKLGFVNWNRKLAMDQEHVEMVLLEYSKLHALSFAFKDQQKEAFYGLCTKLGDNVYNWLTIGKMLDTCKILCEKAKEKINSKTENEMYSTYAEFCNGIEDYMLSYNGKTDKYAAISHADCWSNNMMFKYDGNKLTNTMLLDFQLTRLASIVFDLSFYLCTCADKVIWDNLDHYLDIYYNNLYQQIKQLGSDPSKLIIKEEFLNEFKMNARFGLVKSSFFLKVTLMEATDAPDIGDAVENNFMEKFLIDIKDQDIYTSRFKYLIEYFYKHGYLDKHQ